MQQSQQQQLRAGAIWPHADPGTRPTHVLNRAKLQWISRRDEQALFASAKSDQHHILQLAAIFYGSNISLGFYILEGVQMEGGSKCLAGEKTGKAGFAADRQRRKTLAALAQRPFQHRIMTPADHRCRFATPHTV